MVADDAATDLRLTGTAAEVPIPLGETEVVNAWGLDEDVPDLVVYSWRETWAKAGVFILAGLVVAIVIGVIGWGMVVAHDPDTPSASPPPATAETPTVVKSTMVEPSPTTTATVTVTASPPSPVTVQAQPPARERFAPEPTIGNGWTEGQLATSTCNVMWDGGTRADAVQFVQRISGWGFERASRWTADATASQCPTAGN
jgi:hypothetical protein